MQFILTWHWMTGSWGPGCPEVLCASRLYLCMLLNFFEGRHDLGWMASGVLGWATRTPEAVSPCLDETLGGDLYLV